MLKTILIFLVAIASIAACSGDARVLSPENNTQLQTNIESNKTTQKGFSIIYHCKDDEELKVVRMIEKNKAKKIEVINITFNNITQRLTEAVSESGKKYSNIRWHWYEKSNDNMLTNSLGQILAEQCVAQ